MPNPICYFNSRNLTNEMPDNIKLVRSSARSANMLLVVISEHNDVRIVISGEGLLVSSYPDFLFTNTNKSQILQLSFVDSSQLQNKEEYNNIIEFYQFFSIILLRRVENCRRVLFILLFYNSKQNKILCESFVCSSLPQYKAEQNIHLKVLQFFQEQNTQKCIKNCAFNFPLSRVGELIVKYSFTSNCNCISHAIVQLLCFSCEDITERDSISVIEQLELFPRSIFSLPQQEGVGKTARRVADGKLQGERDSLENESAKFRNYPNFKLNLGGILQ